MILKKDLINFIEKDILGLDFLAKAQLKDDFCNGLQFAGGEEISKIALGVSLNESFLKEAISFGAQACIFHHGLDTRSYKSIFSTSTQKRLKLIIKNDLNILGYHYALDAHPEIGNNAQIIKKLGAEIKESLFDEWGFTAEFINPKSISELKKQCYELFNKEVLSIVGDDVVIKTIGIVSGAAKPSQVEVLEMEQKGVDCYISGETSEHVLYQLEESDIKYLVCGHYATEKFGVLALGDKINEKFGDLLEVKFIDIPNPI